MLCQAAPLSFDVFGYLLHIPRKLRNLSRPRPHKTAEWVQALAKNTYRFECETIGPMTGGDSTQPSLQTSLSKSQERGITGTKSGGGERLLLRL